MRVTDPFDALEGYYAGVQKEAMPERLEENLRRKLRRRPHWILAPIAACLLTILFLHLCVSAGPGSPDMTLPGEIRKRQMAEINPLQDKAAPVQVKSQRDRRDLRA